MDPAPDNCCCFCHKVFRCVGNHYKNCPECNSQDYQHLMSAKTIAKKKNGKAKKVPCPKCGKAFLRLETHLRNSATCKSIEASQQSLFTPPSLHHPTSHTYTSKSHDTSLSDSFVPSTPSLQSLCLSSIHQLVLYPNLHHLALCLHLHHLVLHLHLHHLVLHLHLHHLVLHLHLHHLVLHLPVLYFVIQMYLY